METSAATGPRPMRPLVEGRRAVEGHGRAGGEEPDAARS